MTRLKLALQWFRCELLHEVETDKCWRRCLTCDPIRQRITKAEKAMLSDIAAEVRKDKA